ncbi:hypothetical protein [Pseudomonas sp. PA27(2017)]|uniref:hypothetical protein n=1 Tax=Pseudomonas sp. PA27(2017) TaxID=1932112 RepID=UPI0009605228|nr:hypothetical protein [Pseudomonas sp. PA27(2017)]OLU30648.1 hypothetical protein BVH06_15575 [Pseudomonas sp. PA27(2017)]
MTPSETVSKAFEQMASEITNPRQRESFERIKTACDYLEEQKLKLSPGAIERYCRDRGWDGPKAQSIRNSKDVLLKYLRLRASHQMLAEPRKRTDRGAPLIADESLRAYVQLLQEERDQAVASIARIERGLRSIPGLRVDELLLGKTTTAELDHQSSRPSPMAVEAARRLLDPYLLSKVGLEIFKGRIRGVVTKEVLLEKDHFTAMEALASMSTQ